MTCAKQIKKVSQLILLIATVAIASPYILGKLNFYGAANAATTPTTVTNPTNGAPIQSTALSAPVSYADAVALAGPAVVSIKTTKEIPLEMNPLYQDPFFRYFFGDPNSAGQTPPEEEGTKKGRNPQQGQGEIPKETLQGLGSGVIVSDKGYILTNNHVIKEADKVIVTLADGRVADGTLVGTDPETDLAVIQVKLDKLPVITLGKSQQLRPGDIVLAIGNPFGLDKTVTQGIVSATERSGTDIGILENLIQTDAAINPGNSGGALIDPYGRLVGINTAIYSQSGGSQGIGFAIPIDQATEVMNSIIAGKRILRGYLGVMMQPLTKEIRDSSGYKEGDGVFVRATVQGSPAQKAGLLPGDVILKINNQVVKDERSGLRIVASLTPGQNYPIEIFRKNERLSFTITAGERKPQTKEKQQREPQEQRQPGPGEQR
jgi:Do/DeqQ family serine protease